MKLKEVANIIKGTHIKSKENSSKGEYRYKELTIPSLEPISFIDERKLIEVTTEKRVPSKFLTKRGDVIVSLYFPMIACYVEEHQEGFVIPHYMAVIRMKRGINIDSRFIVQFINSIRGRKTICENVSKLYTIKPTSLPLKYLNNADIRKYENTLLETI